MLLGTLIARLGARRVHGDANREVRSATRDTREAGPGSVFVAIRGANVDGHDLVGRASHAEAIVAERHVEVPPGVTLIEVEDTRRALAICAAALNGWPGEAMRVIAVTGTNGKTTITTLVENALLHLGVPTARIGTTGVSVAGRSLPSPLTTPEAPQVQAFLAAMRGEGVDVVAMEASSIGLAQHRIDAIPFHLAVFTNLTRDHLDFHGTMEAYRQAKARLFRDLLRPAGGRPRALLCADDPAAMGMDAPDDRWTYGFAEGCDLRILSADTGPRGLDLAIRTPEGDGRIRSALVGRYNAQNLAAALGCCLLLGVRLDGALQALSAARGAPGRFEAVPNDRDLLVLVDYAHTDDALASSLRAAREVARGDVWVVFGCGGDRDRGKRPKMGKVAEELADRVVVTSDNPRSEVPLRIVEEILSGMSAVPALVEVDREAAIRWAIESARPGDVVLVAGKGHETYQEIAGEKRPFDDREIARSALGGTP